MWYIIRQIFLKGGNIKDAIAYVFKATGNMPTKSDGMKIINIYQDVQKNTGKVIKFPKDKITPFYKPRPIQTKEKGFIPMKAEQYREMFGKSPKPPKGNINYPEIEKKFGFPLRGNESLSELAKIEKMGRDQYYNSLADRAMSIRTRMSRLDAEGGTEIGYQEFNKLQEELDDLNDFITRVQKEIPEDMASGGLARVGYADGSYKSEGLFGISMEDIRKYKEKEIMDRTPPFAIPDDWLEKFLKRFEKTGTYEQPMASGGLARVGYAGGKIVKGAPWVINKLKEQLFDMDLGIGGSTFSKLTSTQKDFYKKELNTLIKQLEQGGEIPNEMLDTMIADPKFKSVVKTRSTDKDLFELEDALLDRQAGKQADQIVDDVFGPFDADGKLNKKAVLQEVKDSEEKMLLDKFDVKDRKPNASGGIAGQLHMNEGGRASFTKGGKVSSGLANILGV